MFTRILVPLDGSRLAETVLPQAVRLARLHMAELWLLRVAVAHTALSGDPADAQLRAVHEAEVYLSAISDQLERDVSLHTALRYGHAAEEIVDHATVNRVDLILMATHGRTGLAHAILGSVAEHVVRHTPCPVLLYRVRPERAAPSPKAEPLPQPAAVDPTTGMVTLRKILCPVDFTEGSEAALDVAGELAERFQAELTLLHVVYDPVDTLAAHLPHPPLERLKQELIRQAESLAEERVGRRLAHLSTASAAVVAGLPDDEILRYAQEHGVDLIVMATQIPGGPEYVRVRSISERIVRNARCPVLSLQAAAADAPTPAGAAAGRG